VLVKTKPTNAPNFRIYLGKLLDIVNGHCVGRDYTGFVAILPRQAGPFMRCMQDISIDGSDSHGTSDASEKKLILPDENLLLCPLKIDSNIVETVQSMETVQNESPSYHVRMVYRRADSDSCTGEPGIPNGLTFLVRSAGDILPMKRKTKSAVDGKLKPRAKSIATAAKNSPVTQYCTQTPPFTLSDGGIDRLNNLALNGQLASEPSWQCRNGSVDQTPFNQISALPGTVQPTTNSPRSFGRLSGTGLDLNIPDRLIPEDLHPLDQEVEYSDPMNNPFVVGEGQSNLVVEPTSGAGYSHRTTVQRNPILHLQGFPIGSTSGAEYSHSNTAHRSRKLDLQGLEIDLNRLAES
jgi:hypothetical protein